MKKKFIKGPKEDLQITELAKYIGLEIVPLSWNIAFENIKHDSNSCVIEWSSITLIHGY